VSEQALSIFYSQDEMNYSTIPTVFWHYP